MSRNVNLKVYLLLVSAMFFWGLTFIWYKLALPNFSPVSIVLYRLLISTFILFGISRVLNKVEKIQVKDFKFFLILSFFEPFLYFMAESIGLQFISSSLASVIVATIPLFTLVVGYLFFREQVNFINIISILFSFSGVLLVIYSDDISGQASAKGIAIMFLAVFSTQGYAVVLKKLSERYNAFTIVSYQNLIGLFFILPVFLLDSKSKINVEMLTLQNVLPVFYLALFGSTICFLFFVQGIRHIGITRSMVFVNFIPIVTAVFAVFILNESMNFLKGAGILVTISGLLLSQLGAISKNKKTGWKKV